MCPINENDLVRKVPIMVTRNEFGFENGYKCWLFTIKNNNGATLKLTNFGASIVALEVPDRNGNFADVILGYDDLKGYVNGTTFQGAAVGRFANRIGKGKLTIDGVEYQLALNENGVAHLHGGVVSYNKRVWTVENVADNAVTFGYVSPDGEENYPGTLKVLITYSLSEDNAVTINYKAVSDAATAINLTNHSYFNLAGQGNGDIKDHIVKINANKYTPVDDELIPVGEDADVTGTPFDLRQPTRVAEHMDDGTLPAGYDHNFVLSDKAGVEVEAAEVYEPTSGRVVTVTTNLPAMQLYIGIALNAQGGKGGQYYGNYTGLCLETQFSPDTPNRPQLPSCIFKAGEEYNFTTTYKFSVR